MHTSNFLSFTLPVLFLHSRALLLIDVVILVYSFHIVFFNSVDHEMSLESYEEKYVEDMKLDELTKLVDVATAAQSKTSNNAAFIKPVDTENLKEVGKLCTLYIS